MSGIFGIINFNGEPVNRVDLERMSKKMVHRGVDACNIWIKDDVGLGQLMLCSTAESLNEPLPWQDPLSGLVITADARIDNRDELLTKLSINSKSVPPIPDSQLILSAFRKWGEACVDHLLGDFSFAIWDKTNRRLFVARDHMGLRPFYYFSRGDFFVFASAANAVAQASCVPHLINEGRIADFLISELEGINQHSTFFEQVYRMPPAHFGVVEKKKASFTRYWKPDPEARLQLSSDDDYADALEDALTLSIKARLRSQHPASSMLSGGVDSSTVTGIARKLCDENGDKPLRTYSAVSNDISNCCESGYINKMIDHGGLDPVRVSPSEIKQYSSDLERISRHLEDPFDGTWVLVKLIYLTARKHGNVVVMDGVDGDLITGLPESYPAYLLRQGEVKQAFREIGRGRTNYYDGTIGWLKAYTQIIRPVVTPNFLRRLKAAYSAPIPEALLQESMLSKEFAKRARLEDRWKEYQGQSTPGSLQQAHAERIVVPYLTAAIERYNRLASYCGIEARQPFHDKRVVELCLSMPWQQKAYNGWMKYGLRNVLQRVAPAEVAWRSTFDSIMWKFGAAWDEANRKENLATISDNREQLLEILDKKQLDQTLIRYTSGDATAIEPIRNAVTLLKWLQKNQAS